MDVLKHHDGVNDDGNTNAISITHGPCFPPSSRCTHSTCVHGYTLDMDLLVDANAASRLQARNRRQGIPNDRESLKKQLAALEVEIQDPLRDILLNLTGWVKRHG